ncbi:T4P13.26 protein isoform 2 [Hibiscus syriacus]|uniref:T4P13.26 protein isoform 2 n=1 Tax=Hibiscus syriacus TaxID=106335 RepID=A0A6A2ZZM0_HIBSY|nr:T4P13.26 protein isoform 2 [Hibiscus syriacus]
MVAVIAVSSPKSTLFHSPIYLRDSNSSFLAPPQLEAIAVAPPTGFTLTSPASLSPLALFLTGALLGLRLYMAIRTRASFRVQQCVHKHSDDGHQTQIRGTIGSCTYSPYQRVHRGIGPYVEVAFYHKRSRTLLVTDAVIYVPKKPPESINKEYLLASTINGLAVKILSKGKKVIDEPVADNEINRWERMVLQILLLGPSNLLEPKASFAQMSQKFIVSPIVKTLVFSKVPEKVRDWIDGIARDWKFKRIIPAHFTGPIKAGRAELLAAFAFLDDLLGERYVTRPSLSLLFTYLMGKAASYFHTR